MDKIKEYYRLKATQDAYAMCRPYLKVDSNRTTTRPHFGHNLGNLKVGWILNDVTNYWCFCYMYGGVIVVPKT